MNDDLRKKAVVRKVAYFAAILGLFVLSMFWRGTFQLPVGNPNNVTTRDANGNLRPLTGADAFARFPIKYQAEDLEMLERDAGDPEVAGALAQVSLVGIRGFVVTGLWNATITAQKRGEYDDMERTALLLTKLQPHFITPWVFQAWNISYNVSVETDKLGDQYYYIARGISLLAEGDRANTRQHRRGNAVYMIGSPDIRFQLGFYIQNKFSVSDKVATLYSLAQVSMIPPADRDPKRFRKTATAPVDPVQFRDFCEKNPQLVRRLKTKLNLKTPDAVVDFLETNWEIPARYDVKTKQPQAADRAFPVLPVADKSVRDLTDYLEALEKQEKLPSAAGPDAIDIRLVARVWFEHCLTACPPPREGVPTMTPQKGEYDQFRYRIPEKPALIYIRTTPSRAQNYVAERLQKEGWFDEKTVWNPDAAYDRDAKWFPAARPGDPAPVVTLKPGTHALAEWGKVHTMWEDFGRKNGLNPPNLLRQQDLLVVANSAGAVQGAKYSDTELAAMKLTGDHIGAARAIQFYEQNRQITQYQRFLDESLAQMEPELAAAFQKMWDADEMHLRDPDGSEELKTRVEAMTLWRRVFAADKHREFYDQRADTLQETSLDQELKIADLLVKSGDPATAARLKAAREGLAGVSPALLAGSGDKFARAVAADEAQARLALAYALSNPSSTLALRAKDEVRKFQEQFKNSPVQPTVEGTARGLLDGEFSWMKQHAVRDGMEWVKYSVRVDRMQKDGVLAPPAPAPSAVPQGSPGPGRPPGGP